MERQKNIFDKIGSLIPGYSGYAEREGRRNTDKILREKIFQTILDIERLMHTKIDDALKRKDFSLAMEIDGFRKQLNTFASKVKFAPYGESSFFADNQIREEELLAIYQMDMELSEEVIHLLTVVKQDDWPNFSMILNNNRLLLEKRNYYITEFK